MNSICCRYLNMYACMHVCTYVRTYVCMHACMYVYRHALCMFTAICLQTKQHFQQDIDAVWACMLTSWIWAPKENSEQMWLSHSRGSPGSGSKDEHQQVAGQRLCPACSHHHSIPPAGIGLNLWIYIYIIYTHIELYTWVWLRISDPQLYYI